MAQLAEPGFHDELREGVLTAERALLYALGFQLNIDHPHYFATHVVAELGRAGGGVGAFWAAFSAKHVFGPHGNVRAPARIGTQRHAAMCARRSRATACACLAVLPRCL